MIEIFVEWDKLFMFIVCVCHTIIEVNIYLATDIVNE